MYLYSQADFNFSFIFLSLIGLIGYIDFLYKFIKNYKKHKNYLSLPKKLGQEAEDNVNYVLRWLDSNKYIVLKNIYLKYNNTTQEFDNIVISPFGIFNIETKGYSGTIKINNDMTWVRKYDNKETGIGNPMFQIQRHHKILEGILEDVNIIDLIVIGNESTIIEGSENSSVPVLKHDVLLNYIENYNNDKSYNVNLIYNKIMDHRVEKQDDEVVEKTPRWVKYSVVGLLLIFFVSLGFGIYKKYGKVTFINKQYKNQVKNKIQLNKIETTSKGEFKETKTNKVTTSSKNEFKKVATKTLLKGKVNVDVSYKFNKNNLIVKLHVENNADKSISVFDASVTNYAKTGYKFDRLKLGSNIETVPNSTNDMDLVFENVDTSKIPYILNCEFFMLGIFEDMNIKVPLN